MEPESERDAKGEHIFELSGGALCLDFVNTLGDRPIGASEHLNSYSDLLRWGRQAGVLGATQVRMLERQAREQAGKAQSVFRQAVALRETLFRIFASVAAGESPSPDDLTMLNASLERALQFLRVRRHSETYRWEWDAVEKNPDSMLWPVTRSAAELLTSPDSALVRQCDSDRCSWLFLDRSRNHRRRWCDMKVCGNRAKARRHYRRKKKLTRNHEALARRKA